MSNKDEFIKEFEKLYIHYKEAQYTLALAEEIADKKYFSSIVNELRATLHHLLESYEYYKTQEISDDGIHKWKKEFIKAKEEHLMRAVIDAYDSCFNGIKTQVRKIYEQYNTADIVAVFPHYHTKILPYFNALNTKTAEMRTNRNPQLLTTLQQDLIALIDEYHNELVVGVPIIEKHIFEKKKNERKELLKNIAFLIAGGIISLIISICMK